MQLILQSQRNLFWKIGSRYTKKHYNSKGQEVVNSVEVVGHFLCDLENLSFMNGLLKLQIPTFAVTDYLPTWIENQSRIPNDRCAFENNI